MRRCDRAGEWPGSCAALDHLADAEALGARSRTPHRLAPGAARHHHNEITRLVDDRHHGVVVVLVDPQREERTFGLAAILGHSPGLARHLENGLLYVELLPAGGCDVLRIL